MSSEVSLTLFGSTTIFLTAVHKQSKKIVLSDTDIKAVDDDDEVGSESNDQGINFVVSNWGL